MTLERWRRGLVLGLVLAALCGAGFAQPEWATPLSVLDAPGDVLEGSGEGVTDPGPADGLDTGADASLEDAALAARLTATLQSTLSFSGVAASVENGVVTLSGFVATREAVERLERLIGTFPEVRYVENGVIVRPESGLESLGVRLRTYRDSALALLPALLFASLVFAVFWLLGLVVARWRRPVGRLRVNPLMRDILRQLLRSAIVIVGLLLALDLMGASALVGALLGTAGIVGIAVGFAFRDIIENYLAGILLSFRQPFDVNDLLRVENVEGRVVRLTSRELVLMTPEGNHVRLPNALVFKSTLTNFTRNPRRRFDFVVGVDVSEDLKAVQRRLAEVLRAMPGVLHDPAPRTQIEGLGDSNVPIRVFAWVDQREADFGKVRSEAIRLAKRALDEAGVQMPEPIHNVRIKQVSSFAEAPAPRAPRTAAAELEREASAVEVAPDRALEAQVAEDLSRDDENLLKPKEAGT